MIKDRNSILYRMNHSLYFGLFVSIVTGFLICIFTYIGARFLFVSLYERRFLTEEWTRAREDEFFDGLQDYVDGKALTTEDIEALTSFARENKYIQLIVYKNEEMLSPDGSEYGENFGDLEDFRSLRMSDGVLLISVSDMSRSLYTDLSNLFALLLSAIAMSVFLVFYFSRIVKRIRRLSSDVDIVANGVMTHTISKEGTDEIGALSENIENMRVSILENTRREREAIDSNNELITSISHDIRTPLTVLMGYIEMMKNHGIEDSVIEEYVNASENTAMRLKQLSDDMFKYALAFGDNYSNSIIMEEYDAKTLLDQMLFEHVLLMREKGYDVKVEGEGKNLDDGAMIYTDAQNLMRIIDNIFSNMIKYADINHEITVTTKYAGRSVILEFRNKIREALSRAESTGIGLRTCTRLAEKIARGFEFENEGEFFVARLFLEVYQNKKAKTEKKENVSEI